MRKRKATLVAALMDEVIVYGGLPARRADVYRDMLRRTGSEWAADLFAFGSRTQLAPAGAEPLALADLAAFP